MPNFFYMARDQRSLLQSGHLEAVDEDEVLGVLQNRGLVVTRLLRQDSAVAAQAVARRRMARRLHGRVTADDKVLFCQQLAVLLEAGIPLLKSLEVISSQVESRPLLRAIDQMRQDIGGGLTFRNAMATHPKIFSSFWVSLVETGEASGHLAQSLNQLARYVESTRNIQSKAMTAMTYPLVLIGASVVVLTIFVLKVIPVFSGIFASMRVPLPALTTVIIQISDVIRHHFLLIVLGVAAAGYSLRRFVRTPEGRWLVDRLLLRLPVFRQLFLHLQLVQFAQGLGTLLESGVPILFSLEITEQSASNTVYQRAIREVKEFVREGKALADTMGRTGLFPPMMVQMIQVGEEIGELAKMLDRVATYYEGRVDTFVERMTVLFEPIAIIVMGVVIGTIVISMFLPIFQLAGGIQA